MKKEKFLKTLREKLNVLESQEVEDIIEEYKDYIRQKQDDGMTEEEAIQDFGDVESLAKEILKAYKINENYNQKEETELEKNVKNISEKVLDFFQKLIDTIASKSGEEIIQIIVKFILILIMIGLLKIPLYMLMHLGFTVFNLVPDFIGNIFSSIWRILFEFIFAVISIILLYYCTKKYIIDDNVEVKRNTRKSNRSNISEARKPSRGKKQEINEEKVRDSNSGIHILSAIAKIFVAIVSFPFLVAMVGLCIAFGILIALMIKGIFFISVFLILFGLIMMTSSVIGFLFSIIRGLK